MSSSRSTDSSSVATTATLKSQQRGWRWSLIATLGATFAFDAFVVYQLLRLAAAVS